MSIKEQRPAPIEGVTFNTMTLQFEPEQPVCDECGYRHPDRMWCENAADIRSRSVHFRKSIRKLVWRGAVLK